MITPVSDKVRIRSIGDPFTRDDIIVEQLIDGQWQTVQTYNSFSNDYAYTESREFAYSLARTLKGQ